MKKLLAFIFLLFLTQVYGQTTNLGEPVSWSLTQKRGLKMSTINIPEIDIEKVRIQDEIEARKKVKRHRISVANKVNIGLNDDSWINLPNGDRVWKVLFHSKDALNLSVVFDKFYIPEGAKLYLYSDDRTDLQGAYTSINNNKKQKLGSWLVEGDKVWVEYYEPKEVTGQGILNISQVMHGYRLGKKYQKGYFDNKKSLNSSGDCNHDVNCPIGDDFDAKKDILKKSIAFILMPDTDGTFICSGSLVNNTQQDKKPYFLTANHCYEKEDGSTLDESLYSMRFNWISPNPVCGSTNDSSDTTINQVINGSTLRARNGASDFMLLELNNNIPEDWKVVYAGWDKTDANPSFEVGIHHPDGDIMKVSRDNDGATKTSSSGVDLWLIGGESAGSGNGWEIGVTEGGSSGSPLFNQNGHIIGQLFAGNAACTGTTDNDDYDIYGRFATSWNGSSSSNRLKDWLDPTNVNPNTLPELKSEQLFAYDASASSKVNIECSNEQITPTVKIQNKGKNTLTSLLITYNYNDQNEKSLTWTGSLLTNQSEDVQIPTTTLPVGTHKLNITVSNPNQEDDLNELNNTTISNFTITDFIDSSVVNLELKTDDNPEQTSWKLKNQNDEIIEQGGPYNESDKNTVIKESLVLSNKSCYTFEIFDTKGNGISNNGSYKLTSDDDTVLINSNGNFSFSEITTIKTETLKFKPERIALYPNPSNDGVFTIKGFVDGLKYELYNQLGQRLISNSLPNNTINISEIASGIYYVRITDTKEGNNIVKTIFLGK